MSTSGTGSGLQLLIGDYYNVFSPQAAAQALATNEGVNKPLLLRVLASMVETGPQRFVSKPSSSACLDPLEAACPHFKPVIDDLRKYIELALFGNSPFNFMPLLLAGDPGVGKTYFAKMLAAALGVSDFFMSMASTTASFVIAGSAPTWEGARHGKVAQTLVTGGYANPLGILDELDKAGGDSRYDTVGTLLELLEKDTARHFRDEFLDVEFDASQMLWVGTANDLSVMTKPLLSRMMVYEVQGPTAEQAAVIAQRIYSALMQEHTLPFAPTLETDVLAKLSAVAPRDMKMRIIEAMGAARVGRRAHLMADDVKAAKAVKRGPGFTH